MNKRKICVITGTRAEYGLLYWLMKEIQADNELELQLIVTGMHLSPEFQYFKNTFQKLASSFYKMHRFLLQNKVVLNSIKFCNPKYYIL